MQLFECPSLTADEAVLKDNCWIPFGLKTVSIEAEGGILCLEPPSNELEEIKEDTIFVEVPPGAVSASAKVEMHYAIILGGPFTLQEGYQFGSPIVYIYYDSRHVTKPLTLHLPHWCGGGDHTRDGLSFAIAPHSLKASVHMYHFQLLAGGEFPISSQYGVIEMYGHHSLYAEVFKLGTTPMCFAIFLVKENIGETECKTECNIAVTYSSYHWIEVISSAVSNHVCTALFIWNMNNDLCFYVFYTDIEAEQTWLGCVKA